MLTWKCVLLLALPATLLGAEPPSDWPRCQPFVRADGNGDGEIDISDPVFLLLYLFSEDPPPAACLDAADADDSEDLDLTDVIFSVQYLFLAGPPPPAPFPTPGTDEPCNRQDDDGDGQIDEGCPSSSKDWSRYSAREVFLVSDADWRAVLTLVPVTTWKGGECNGTGPGEGICAFPTLIVHVEETAFDADSIIYFLRAYEPARVTVAGSIPPLLEELLVEDPEIGLSEDDLRAIQASDFPAYWEHSPDAVVVEDDYELALLAAAFASLINAPLIIEGFNSGIDLTGKRVLCVGEPGAERCDEQYSLQELQEAYLELTGTDRIILTRPDLSIFKPEPKATQLSGTVGRLFGQTSLASAVLAAAKAELIVPVHAREVDLVDSELRAAMDLPNLEPRYLTILASPLEIQQTIQFTRDYGATVTWSIDNTRYGNMDSDPFGFAELKTGRIYGFTASDVSAYVARAIFHESMSRADDCMFIGQGVGAADQNARLYASIFAASGYSTDYRTYANPAQPADWASKALINNDAHGSPYYSTISTEQIPIIDETVIFTASCLTCAFDKLSANNFGRLFCTELLRKGALGVVASVDTAGFNWDSTRLNGVLYRDLGSVHRAVQNVDHARNKWYIEDLAHKDDYRDLQADIQFLLGDPTITAGFAPQILPATECEIDHGPDVISIQFWVHSLNILDGGTAYIFIEGTDSFIQARYGRFFLKAGPIVLFESYSLESDDVDPISFGGLSDVALQEDEGQTYIYFLVEKDFSANPLDEVTENHITILVRRT